MEKDKGVLHKTHLWLSMRGKGPADAIRWGCNTAERKNTDSGKVSPLLLLEPWRSKRALILMERNITTLVEQ